MNPSRKYSWYSDYAEFPYSGASWFSRGGNYGNGVGTGLFNFNYKDGGTNSYISTRAVISNLS